jgi:cytochrome c oxidase cbb3-type subunit 3
MRAHNWISFGVSAALILTLAACRRDISGVLATSAPFTAPSPNRTVVGPVPGPDKYVPHASNPFAGNKVATTEGFQLFNRMNCSGCHGTHAGGGMGPSLRDVDWIYGSEDAQIFSSIAEGRAHGMPTWGPKMGDDQIWKMVAYIKSLRTRNEPEAPEP